MAARVRRPRLRHCSICGTAGHDRRSHRTYKGRRRNPDFFFDKFGRPHPIRGTPDYEEGFPVPPRRSPYRAGPRGGYTLELPGREMRAAAAKLTRKEKRRRPLGRAKGSSLNYAEREAAESGRFVARRKSRLY